MSQDPAPVRQATVHEFDQQSGSGSVIADDGRVFGFDSAVFAASPLLTLRVGQRLRVSVEGSPPAVTALTLVTFPDPA